MNYKINSVNILVIGDLMLDHYIYGNCNRISPEAPVPVVEVKQDDYTLGGAGNVLQNLIAFNCSANIISITGDDDDAITVNYQLSKAGISDARVIRDKKRCTTVKSRVMVSNHQLIRLDREDTRPIDEDIVNLLTDAIKF